MLDPTRITNHNATAGELEEMILFWIAAAGKNGVVAARAIDKLLHGYRHVLPFTAILSMGYNLLRDRLKTGGLGCSKKKARSIWQLVECATMGGIDLRFCTADDLEKIYGIGRKTSRCFLIHSRPNVEHIGVDRHILRYLCKRGYARVPLNTPNSYRQYFYWEQVALVEAAKHGMTPAEFDLAVWNYSRTFLHFMRKRRVWGLKKNGKKINRDTGNVSDNASVPA